MFPERMQERCRSEGQKPATYPAGCGSHVRWGLALVNAFERSIVGSALRRAVGD
jgi:hypothetical protein